MNNQYSRGCGYNYRRSAQRDMNMARSSGNRVQNLPTGEAGCCPAEKRIMADGCGCIEPREADRNDVRRTEEERSLAMGYVPVQMWSNPLPVCQGLKIGTIFADLHKPFCGKGGLCR